LTLFDCTLAANQAVGGAGGSGNSGGASLGGGLSILTSCSASVSASTVNANTAQGGAAGVGGSSGQGIGGGVYDQGLFTFDLSTVIEGNHASTSNDDVFP
jgi:hypothetical protein